MLFLATSATADRPAPLASLYATLGELNDAVDGPYFLGSCAGRMDWPDRGLYFFFDPASGLAHDPPAEWCLVRIGTVGVATGSSNTLWERLRQHRGNTSGAYAGGGNHRGSIFRQHVGRALIERDGLGDEYPYWGTTHAQGIDLDTTALREQEHPLEERVSAYIRALPFLYVAVPGEPAPGNERDQLETTLIALVSHYRMAAPHPHRDDWLGTHSPTPAIHTTGLWNIDHTGELFSRSSPERLGTYVESTTPAE